MKRIAILLMALVMALFFAACGSNEKSKSEEVSEASAEDKNKMTYDEEVLFETIKKMSYSFFEPSAVRVIEIGHIQYQDIVGGRYYDRDLGDGFYGVIVRIQGENKVGGTLSHYYLIRLDSVSKELEEQGAYVNASIHWERKKDNEYPHTSFDSLEAYKKFMASYVIDSDYCNYKLNAEGHYDYIGLESIYYKELSRDSINLDKDLSYFFDVAKINKALKEYWEDMGV